MSKREDGQLQNFDRPGAVANHVAGSIAKRRNEGVAPLREAALRNSHRPCFQELRRTFLHFRPAVCLTVIDPESHEPLPTNHLQSAFGLTEAEARLAERLALGEDLRAAAENLKITYGTARTRLAEIFLED